MDRKDALAATAARDASTGRWVLVIEGPTGDPIEEVELAWDGGGGFPDVGIDHAARLLNDRGLGYVGAWTPHDADRWTAMVHPIANWWLRPRGPGDAS